MNLEEIDIHSLLPQQEPFVMIHKLLYFDEVKTVTSMTVREDHLYCEDGQLNACALIENIAQTCAARMGYINKYIYKEKVKLGFIGSVRNMVIRRTPRLGETITTTIEVVQEIMKLTLVNAEVRVGDEIIVTAEMKIAISDEDMQDMASPNHQ